MLCHVLLHFLPACISFSGLDFLRLSVIYSNLCTLSVFLSSVFFFSLLSRMSRLPRLLFFSYLLVWTFLLVSCLPYFLLPSSSKECYTTKTLVQTMVREGFALEHITTSPTIKMHLLDSGLIRW